METPLSEAKINELLAKAKGKISIVRYTVREGPITPIERLKLLRESKQEGNFPSSFENILTAAQNGSREVEVTLNLPLRNTLEGLGFVVENSQRYYTWDQMKVSW